jgi:uncharacterized protein YndB with AHSA1/START domain
MLKGIAIMADSTQARRTDTASRIIAAPPQRIYRAFLDPDALVKWLPPEGMTGRVYEFEPHEAGVFRMALTYQGDHPSVRGKTSKDMDLFDAHFLELIPDARIVMIVKFQSDDPAFAGEMRMIWDLSPATGGTLVAITCENVPEGILQEDHDAGLRSTLENLATFVE